MIYPDNFELKIGFDEIRTMLKGRCLSTLGTEWVDKHLAFSTRYEEVMHLLALAKDYERFADEDEEYEENFFDVRQALLRIHPERTHLEEIELFDLKRSLQTVVDLTSFFMEVDEEGDDEHKETYKYPALRKLAMEVKTFPQVIRRIDEILNKYGKIKDTASAELLNIRRTLESTSRSIGHNLRSIIANAQSEGYIDRDVAPTMRDGRLVIPVAPGMKRKLRGIVHDESATGKTVFIEPASVVEANNRVRELQAKERREIIRILQELTTMIRPAAKDMMKSLKFLAQVDFLRAQNNFSESFDCSIPNVKKFPHIDWAQAIHPLLQQSMQRHGQNQVPLDVTLQGKARILLISGPNAGGKSVVLKTIGLLQYMLQCGMPVPMKENSVMGMFDDVFISIGDEQNIENELSTYSSHLVGMKKMMKFAASKSLLLIDEFGGGTEPQIGGAMAEAMLHQFVQNQTYGIITTHFQNLKHYADKHPTVVNGAMLYDRAKMQPLFLLRIGHPGSSFAIEIARKIGIPMEVINYASNLVGKDYVMSDKYLQDIARDKMYWESKRQKVRSQEKQLEASLANYEQELKEFRSEKKQVLAKAKAEAQELLKASNAQIENTIREIKEAQAEKIKTKEARESLNEWSETLVKEEGMDEEIQRKIDKIKRRKERKKNKVKGEGKNALAGLVSTMKRQNTEKKKVAQLQKIEVGNYVRIKGQTAVGRVETITGKVARVLFGVMNTSVPLDRLQKTQKPQEDKVAQAATFITRETRDAIYEKKLRFKPDIDVRGMRAEEALNHVRDFVDDAILLEQPQVRILHGTGSGALRQAIRQYLKTVPGVAHAKDEHVQFGGAGISVVELK